MRPSKQLMTDQSFGSSLVRHDISSKDKTSVDNSITSSESIKNKENHLGLNIVDEKNERNERNEQLKRKPKSMFKRMLSYSGNRLNRNRLDRNETIDRNSIKPKQNRTSNKKKSSGNCCRPFATFTSSLKFWKKIQIESMKTLV